MIVSVLYLYTPIGWVCPLVGCVLLGFEYLVIAWFSIHFEWFQCAFFVSRDVSLWCIFGTLSFLVFLVSFSDWPCRHPSTLARTYPDCSRTLTWKRCAKMLQTKPLDKCRPDISPPTHKLKGFATSPIARPHCGGSEQTSAADEQKKGWTKLQRGAQEKCPPKSVVGGFGFLSRCHLGPEFRCELLS